MDHDGSWLLGMSGAERLCQLALRLKIETLRRAEKITGRTFEEYAPWMCCPSRYDYWMSHSAQANGASQNTVTILSGREDLQHLYNVFAKADDDPFGHCDFPNAKLRVNNFGGDVDAAKSFHQKVRDAYDRVKRSSVAFELRVNTIVSQIIPLGPVSSNYVPRKNGNGLSLHHYRGAVFLGQPEQSQYSHIEFAINLAHELGHQALFVYQYADQIILSNHAEPVYSAVRKTARPALMSFHALVALAYMLEFLRANERIATDKEELSYIHRRRCEIAVDADAGWQALQRVTFTQLGECLMNEFRSQLNEAEVF